MPPTDTNRPAARCFKGFRDVFADDLLRKRWMVDTVRAVYERYGFVPLETPAVEFVDVLGKFLPESSTPAGGIFSFRNPDLEPGDERAPSDVWLALRYDLTAPLARVVAQYAELPRPFRRYQVGSVWRYEKPGPGRFREFTQLDFDSVGVPTVAADAECCMVIADVMEALGFARGQFETRVSNRKLLQGVLQAAGLGELDVGAAETQAGIALRAIDKLDRLGIAGVTQLLGRGRRDETGDFTAGALLQPAQIDVLVRFLSVREGAAGRSAVLGALDGLIGSTPLGREGIDELSTMDALLRSSGYMDDRVVLDPTIVRGLGYYTGPVFETVLTTPMVDASGVERSFGSVFSGGRYDGLVERFTGQKIPATGASVGVDRLIEALKILRPGARSSTAEVLVVAMDPARMGSYFELARSLRSAGVNTELFLGAGGMGKQLKYADKVGVPLAVIAGSDEFDRGTVQIKDLRLGRELAGSVGSREEWRKGQPAQQEVPIGQVVAVVQGLLGRPEPTADGVR